MKFSLSLSALAALAAAVNACQMDICAIGGGCTTVVSGDFNNHALPGGTPPYIRNLRYAKIITGQVILDVFFGNVIAYSPGDVLTIENIPNLNQVSSWECLVI